MEIARILMEVKNVEYLQLMYLSVVFVRSVITGNYSFCRQCNLILIAEPLIRDYLACKYRSHYGKNQLRNKGFT